MSFGTFLHASTVRCVHMASQSVFLHLRCQSYGPQQQCFFLAFLCLYCIRIVAQCCCECLLVLGTNKEFTYKLTFFISSGVVM